MEKAKPLLQLTHLTQAKSAPIRSSVMPSADRLLRVFLCHIIPLWDAHADRHRVHALYNRLTKDGVDRFAWLDKERLIPGQDWELEIRKAV